MKKKFLPANFVRPTKTNSPAGGFPDFDVKKYITSTFAWLKTTDAIYPLEGAFVVDADTVVVDSAATIDVTSGTALTVAATLGDIGINAGDGNVITAASLAITSTATAGDATLASTNGDVVLNAGVDIILTPTANLTFALAAIPTYADDTAAGVGGLTAGQVYKTAAGSLFIKL